MVRGIEASAKASTMSGAYLREIRTMACYGVSVSDRARDETPVVVPHRYQEYVILYHACVSRQLYM